MPPWWTHGYPRLRNGQTSPQSDLFFLALVRSLRNTKPQVASIGIIQARPTTHSSQAKNTSAARSEDHTYKIEAAKLLSFHSEPPRPLRQLGRLRALQDFRELRTGESDWETWLRPLEIRVSILISILDLAQINCKGNLDLIKKIDLCGPLSPLTWRDQSFTSTKIDEVLKLLQLQWMNFLLACHSSELRYLTIVLYSGRKVDISLFL